MKFMPWTHTPEYFLTNDWVTPVNDKRGENGKDKVPLFTQGKKTRKALRKKKKTQKCSSFSPDRRLLLSLALIAEVDFCGRKTVSPPKPLWSPPITVSPRGAAHHSITAGRRRSRRQLGGGVRAGVPDPARGRGARRRGMDDGIGGVQESSDMSISSDDDGIKQQRESNVELAHDRAEAHPDGLLREPEVGMSFGTETEVREYYNTYAKAKGFGVTRRSSNRDDNGQLKYLTFSCSRYGKAQSNSGNMLKPSRTVGTGCKAKINITRAPDGRFHLSTVILDHNHALSPLKPRRFRCNKKLDFRVKRRLELNDPAEIRVNKSSTIPRVTHFDIEKQFQSAYTNSKFKEFQEELTQTMYCDRKLMQKEGAIETYEITEDVLIDEDKGWRKDIVHHVYFSEEEFEVKCSCRRFEFTGILCRHVLCVLTHKKIKEVPPQYVLDRSKKNVNRKHNFIRCTYGGMEDTPAAERFDRLCNSFYPVAEIGSMSDDSCNALIEELRTLKIRFSSNSSSENGKEHVATREDAHSNGKTTSKNIPSPIAVRCAGCPPSLRKESMLDKLICQASEKKKEAEQKASSTNLNKKRPRKNRKSSVDDILEQHVMEHSSQQPLCLDGPASSITSQRTFDLAITTSNINPSVTATIPSGGSSTMVMPQILGEYTLMPFQVQQGSAIVSSSAELHFDGTGGLNNTAERS
ncbi:hypothetical protein VPH35_127351 [Triticum aestivum]|uniref:uncharacterized protein n=1 Tax=Triticum aestivum TaxID=4565 RepID=UPI000DF57A0C|nr:uncharacterized protein LOC123160344 [Triticum aestivum]